MARTLTEIEEVVRKYFLCQTCGKRSVFQLSEKDLKYYELTPWYCDEHCTHQAMEKTDSGYYCYQCRTTFALKVFITA